ncbi:MAG: glycosyltransferase, partial [Desulfuromonadales bacterium]|nr:glycosyltransferase [Desulfuromonadales bacterium]
MYKIVLLIDYLCPGGAQRQLCMLAVLLKRRGLQVEILTYYPADFYSEMLATENINSTYIRAKSKVGRVLKLRREIRQRQPDVIVSFLHTPNLIAELAGFPLKHFKVVASERNTDFGKLDSAKRIRYFFHLLADAVVTNAHAQRDYLSCNASYLSTKVQVITNCVDLDYFNPSGRVEPKDCVKILSIGRYHPQKN